MKKLINTLLLVFICQCALAQSAALDQSKLLELYQTQRYADAVQYLQTIYPENTRDIKALNQIAYGNLMAGKLADAEKIYLTLNEIQPNTLPVLFNLAYVNTRRGNDLKAKGYLEQIVKQDTTNFKAIKQLAGLIKDSLSLKIYYLEKANFLNKADADVAIDLADAYKQTKQYTTAYQVLKTANQLDTGNLFLTEAILPIANELKKYAEVVLLGETLLKNGGDIKIVKDVAKAYFYLKDYKKAIAYFQMLEKAQLQNEMSLYLTTLSYRELKDLPMAINYAKKTIDEGISTNTAIYYSLLAGLQENNGKLTTAITSYKRGLTFNEYNNIYYNLGLLYDLKLKQPQKAINYYKLYLNNKPNQKTDKSQIEYVSARLAELKKPIK